MDALSGLLEGPRAASAFLLRSELDPPWGLRIQDEAPLTVMAVLDGEAWVRFDEGDEPPIRLAAGDVGLVRGPEHYVVSDTPTTAPDIVIHPGQRCTTLDGKDLQEEMLLGIRRWGHPGGATKLLTGTYEMDAEVSNRLLSALPRSLVLRAGEFDSPVLAWLSEEMQRDMPGQNVMLDRMLDLLVIAIVRTWFSQPGVEPPPWFAAFGDPIVGPALRLLSDNPSHPWTVHELAHRVGASRAGFARRFSDLLGEPPMTHLTSWRMALAADLLRDPDESVTSVAAKVGYRTPYSFSAAFKRVHGQSPSSFRSAAS